ncbi:alpha/beta-hydrolase [Fomitiporia mediterranea MF3/22]|uniref:alpha/beta-hydrolase n=1 Tax=Fomitiporia mediterranea (strain MF3/22) TaxID=694068 RepID=UPI0004409AEF|nr:alpha/beta-hydrolase [Fomitiporia mediterranea MF3/22]EJD06742.1 alpha/beta-hydrolase [Fomitiporia mediterranea MF3/22]
MSLLSLSRSFPPLRSRHATYKIKRCLSSVPPVDLAHEIYSFNSHSSKGPLLIAHGLFGSKRNWTTLGKTFAKRLQRPVIPLDLRNFGESPQRDVMDYNTQASDILHFCDKHSLKNVSILGHSMGGKAAMTLALRPDLPKCLISHLIVADISPLKGKLSVEFRRYLDGMINLEKNGNIKTKKEAFEALHEVEPDALIRHFLLTNLDATYHGHPVKFRIPLETIKASLDDLGDFPYKPGEASWDGPTLFLKGSKSNYIKEKNIDKLKQFFPNMELETLDAGHWVHYEQ